MKLNCSSLKHEHQKTTINLLPNVFFTSQVTNQLLKSTIFLDHSNISSSKFENFPRHYTRKGKNSFKRSKINCYVYKPLVRSDSMKNVLGVSLERYVDPNSGERYNIRRKLKHHDLQKPILVLFKEQGYDQSLIHGIRFF